MFDCKDKAFLLYMQKNGRKNRDYGLICCVFAIFIIINYRFSVFLLYLWKLKFNNLIMED